MNNFERRFACDFLPQSMAELEKYILPSSDRFCDYTLGSLFMWAGFFENKYEIFDGSLITTGLDVFGHHSFMPPAFATAPTNEAEKAAIAHIYNYSVKKHGYLKLYPVAEGKVSEYIEILEALSGKRAEAEILQDWFDYVYLADDLINLTGKKYHGQRNHINRFKRDYPEHTLEVIGAGNLAEALELASGLAKVTGDTPIGAYENAAVVKVLDNLDAVKQTGLLLKVGGKAVALSVSEVVGDTLYVHVEKADREFSGSFPFISNLTTAFMKERHPEMIYVNREEDLGDSGMRYSKECYHPLYKNFKYYIFLKNDIM